jgi:hypothetical protein
MCGRGYGDSLHVVGEQYFELSEEMRILKNIIAF